MLGERSGEHRLAGVMLGYEAGSAESLQHFEDGHDSSAASDLGQLGCLAFLAGVARAKGVDLTALQAEPDVCPGARAARASSCCLLEQPTYH